VKEARSEAGGKENREHALRQIERKPVGHFLASGSCWKRESHTLVWWLCEMHHQCGSRSAKALEKKWLVGVAGGKRDIAE